MKAIDLIKILQDKVEKYGDNIEVFAEIGGFNGEANYSISENVGDNISIGSYEEDGYARIEDYPEELILEKWDDECGTGMLRGIVLKSYECISIDG